MKKRIKTKVAVQHRIGRVVARRGTRLSMRTVHGWLNTCIMNICTFYINLIKVQTVSLLEKQELHYFMDRVVKKSSRGESKEGKTPTQNN
jgi:hypothetical protein